MGLIHFSLLALSGTQAWAASASGSRPAKRQSTTTKYCPGGTEICFSEYREPAHDIAYRIAIPDVSAAPFDVLLQIVAPLDKAGWAAIAWGGSMNYNPLTVAWPNGDSAVVSSRWSTSRVVPSAYAGATYSVLPTTSTNETHWQLDVLCTGCSEWEGGALDPNGENPLAWAKNTRAVTTPSSNSSRFMLHDGRGFFYHDLSIAKIPQGVFDAVAYGLNNPSPEESSSSSAAAAVSTSVVAIPVPATSSSSSAPSTLPSSSDEIPSSSNESPASSSSPAPVVTTRVVQLPDPKPTSSSVPPVLPTTATTAAQSSAATSEVTTPDTVTVTVTAQPPSVTTCSTPATTTTEDDGSGEGPWGGGGGGGGWGKGKGGGGGWGRGRGRRGRLAAAPE